MSGNESYAQLHSKQRSQDQPRNRSPPPAPQSRQTVAQYEQLLSDLNSKASKTDLQELSLKLSEAYAKIGSLTSIVKLVQKYTETQDLQYEQERQSLLNRYATLNTLIADQQRRMDREERRFFELSELYTQYRTELDEMKKLQTMASVEHLRSHVESQRTFKYEHRDVLRETYVKEAIKGAEDRLRMELNRKLEICMEELRNAPTRREFETLASEVRTAQPSLDVGRSWQYGSDNAAVSREIESIKQTIETLVGSRGSKSKSPSKSNLAKDRRYQDVVRQQDLIEFRDEVDLKLQHVVDKFSQIVKRYVGRSISPQFKRTENTTIERDTLRKDEKDVPYNRHPNISDYNTNKEPKGRNRSQERQEPPPKQIKKSASLQRKRSYRRSKSKSRSRSQSVSKHSHKSKKSDNSSRPKGIIDKRRQKYYQLREMMRKAKEQRKQKEKKVRML